MMRSQRKAMSVAFIRTGERRYAVRAMLDGAPPLEMNPAPGFDPLMPHDLQHFIVEKQLGIEGGVFGRLAAGGTARSFHALADDMSAREASRLRRKQGAKDRRLMPDRTEDYARSERATYVCWHDWLSHASDAALRARAAQMREAAGNMLRRMGSAERASYTAEKLREIRAEFERLSARWSALRIGDSLIERW
jgi:hypothetical protein